MTSGRRARRSRGPSNQGGIGRRGVALAIAGAALAAVAVWGAFVALGGESAEPTADRFMHLHGIAVTGWAPEQLYVSTHSGLIEVDEIGRATGRERVCQYV